MKSPVHKINLRLPMELAEEVKAQAEALGISVNAYLLDAVWRQVRRVRRDLAWDSKDAAPAPALLQQVARVGRNEPCPCGSGRKAKHCHPENC